MKKNKRVNKKLKVSNSRLEVNTRLIANIFLIVFLLLGSVYIFVMARDISVSKKNLLISYTEESDISYEVVLKDNPYYPTKVLGMNQQYPQTLIDKIRVKVDYKFLTSKESNYKYRYFATATLVANNKTNNLNEKNNNVLTKTIQLENETTGNLIKELEFNKNQIYDIDYNYFNNYILNFKKDCNLSLDSYVKVNIYVEVINTYNDNIINKTKTMEVKIPLLTNPFSITVNNPTNLSKDIYEEESLITSNTFFITLAVVMFVSGILLVIQDLRKVIKSDKEQSRYLNKLNKIMAANSEVIVKIKNKINFKNSNIIEVESINELLDAQNELRIPIIYYETKRNKEGIFVIVNGKEVWRYVLKVEDEK